MADTVQNRCRICLDIGNDHVSILLDPTVYLHIKTCLSINILSNDDLPKKICTSCVSQLRNFYNFHINAKFSQEWLESVINGKKKTETKVHVHPLPDPEYNSDSLLEFLNNTENIEEYLNNLGKDLPSIVNIMDTITEVPSGKTNQIHKPKNDSPKDEETAAQTCMDIDVLDSDTEIVQEILMREAEPNIQNDDAKFKCYGCKEIFGSVFKLCQHLSICDMAMRTCIHCNMLFDSQPKMKQHILIHSFETSVTCDCGSTFDNKYSLMNHNKYCNANHFTSYMGITHRCKECGQIFNDRNRLFRHAKQHVLEVQKRICDMCGHCLMGDEELNKHKMEVHDISNGYLFKCKICSLTGTNQKEVLQHIRGHLDSVEKGEHLCEHCGKCFLTQKSLVHHMQQHTTTESHQCHVCDITFTNARIRDQHLRRHREVSICEKCGLPVLCSFWNMHKCM